MENSMMSKKKFRLLKGDEFFFLFGVFILFLGIQPINQSFFCCLGCQLI